MSCSKFKVSKGGRVRGTFYSSEAVDVSEEEKFEICKRLGLGFPTKDINFAPTHETKDALQLLDPTPMFTSKSGRKFWDLRRF